MTKVRVKFTNTFGRDFEWDFEINKNDHEEAISEAILIFLSVLTWVESMEAEMTALAHSEYIPPNALL